MRDYCSGAYTSLKFYLASTKEAVFFACLIALFLILQNSLRQLRSAMAQKKLWTDILTGLAIASIFIFFLRPAAMGSYYAQLSVDPFMQEPGFFNRRILLPALANFFHLSGSMYGVFFWVVAALVFALTNIYFQTKGLVLSRIELASLFTVGMFASTLGLPGYGEILVLGFTLLAILDFERNGVSSQVQVVCFGLALLAHESAAVVAFGVLGIFMFGPRFLLAYAGVLGMYVLVWLLSFHFDAGVAFRTQLTGGISNAETFRDGIPLVLFSIPAAFKLTALLALAAIVKFVGSRDFRHAGLVGCAIVGATALTYVATDYTRMVSFGTFAILISMAAVLPEVSFRHRQMLAAINLILPTVYVSAHHGLSPYNGVYGFFIRHLVGLHG